MSPKLKAALGLFGRMEFSFALKRSLLMSSLPLRCRNGDSKAKPLPKLELWLYDKSCILSARI